MAKILLVDDDHDLAEMLSELLSMMDHQVEVAAEGSAAVAALRASSFDLIMLDWQLPDVSGVEICKQYRESGGTATVLMLTGMRDEASRAVGRAAGATDFLTKPFSVEQLMERLQKLVPS